MTNIAPARACNYYLSPNPHIPATQSNLCLRCEQPIILVDRPDTAGYFHTYNITRTVIIEWP